MERQRATVLGLTACALGAAVRDARRKAATATAAVVGAAGGERGAEAAPFRLGYVTDVEGNLDYFARFVDICPVLSYARGAIAGDPDAELVLEPGCHFVFGGDLVDKGPGDIRLCRQLVALKRRHPDRVFLLVGNRDLNKVRYTAELGDDDMARPIDAIPQAHWDPKATTLREHLSAVTGGGDEAALRAANTREERLRYMHQHTLGCPDTFEFRRQELALLAGRDLSCVTDAQVVENFIADIASEDGALRQYLAHADVAVVLGNTLFVHGAVDAQTMAFVPSHTRFELPQVKQPPAAAGMGVADWAAGLNRYLREGLADHAARPTWDAARRSRGGESLMALQNRAAMWGRTVVSNCYADGGNITSGSAVAKMEEAWARGEEDSLAWEGVSSDPRDPAVAAWLLRGGVRRVVVGHKPSGDSPAALSSSYTGVEVISADTSFSDTSAADNRGAAVCSLLLRGESAESNRAVMHGTLRDGRAYRSELPTLRSGDTGGAGGDRQLGTEAEGGWWWKARLAHGGGYVQCRGTGRTVEYRDVEV